MVLNPLCAGVALPELRGSSEVAVLGHRYHGAENGIPQPSLSPWWETLHPAPGSVLVPLISSAPKMVLE